jgi:hypothetical protein
LVEQLTLNQRVAGSSPSGITKLRKTELEKARFFDWFFRVLFLKEKTRITPLIYVNTNVILLISFMEQMLTAAVNDAVVGEEKERFLVINGAALKRSGVILRLLSILVCFVAIILSAALPMVTIQYATYSSSTTFSSERAARFPQELISGWNTLFGGDYFSYYLKSKYGPELLYTTKANFNGISFGILLFAIVIAVLAFFVTFSKKMEKYSKIVTLGYFIGGLGMLCSPIWFMVVNSFGNTMATATTDLTHYFVYDSLYVHCAYGAIVSCLVFVLAAVLFGVGTSREMAGGDNRGGEN